MRVLLALLAVLGLLTSPVSAAAAQIACSQMTASSSASMSSADALGMAGMQQGGVKKAGDSCCSHGKGCPAKSCAQLCAAACAVSDALAGPLVSLPVPFALAAADHAPAPGASVHPFDPAGAERPPKSIA